MTKWLAILLIISSISCATSQSRNSNPISDEKNRYTNILSEAANNAYNSGRMLILFSYAEHTTETEAFSDWQAYQQDFIDSSTLSPFSEKIEKTSLHSLLNLSTSTDQFTVFIRRGFPTYYYSDLIVEPQVYRAVESTYSGNRLTEEDHAFLPEKLDD